LPPPADDRPGAPREAGALGVGPGTIDTFGTLRPGASDTIAIVLAVNCPAQAPTVGRQERSSRASVASSIAPVSTVPTAS
jgi:hypothetical protein